MSGVQLEDNPITYTSREVTVGNNGVASSDSTVATTQNDKDEETTSISSSEAEEDVPQSRADILAAAGVSINLEELQMLQAEQAPLELVTEVRCKFYGS